MKHQHQIRVRYGECDQMGFVHHSRYALYLEEARTEILRSNGLAYKDMEDEGIIMPVRSMHFEFKKAARYDDLLNVEVKVDGDIGVRMNFNYSIFNQENILLCVARTEMFFAHKETLRPLKLPEKYLSFMK